MKAYILTIGKVKKSPEMEIFNSYLKRTPWEIILKEFELKKDLPENERKEKEADLLLEAVPSGAFVIAMDERGKIISSEELAGQISEMQNRGHSSICFLIGGAYGHGSRIYERADMKLSLGKMTWPHMLVRAMISEQIYRVWTIMNGHPYHK